MRSFVCLLAVLSLISGGSTSCFAQQTTGPATLENLLDAPDRPPLNPTAKDKDTPFPPVAPDEAAVKEAQDLIKQAYEDDYKAAAKNPEPLIQKLLAAAGQTKDPVRRYAYLISAEEAAVTGGDYGRTMELIDIRAGEFAIDGLQSRMDRLAEFLTPKAKTDPAALARLYEHSIETSERGVKQDSLEQAKAAAEMAASIAKSIFLTGKAKKNDGVADDGEAKQTQARALVKDIERRAGLFAEYQKALETIKAKEDPAANGVIGRYLCFAVGDWKRGLPFLAKGDQKDLADVAGEELRVFADGTPDAKDVFSLAGKWWAAADAKDVPDSLETAVRSHAGGLYESIWERLDDPLDKAVAQKRMRDAPAAQASGDSGSGDVKADRLAKPKRILVIAEPKTEQEAAVRASQKYKMRLDGTKSFADVINRLEQYDVVVCCSNSMDYWGDNEDRKKPAAFEPVDRFIARGGHCVIFGAWNGRNMQHLGRYGIRTGFQHTSFFKPVAGVTDVFLAGAEDLVPADKRLQSTGNFTCEAPHTVLLDRDDGRGPAMITLSRGKGRLTFSQVEPMWPEDKHSLWIIGATFSWVARGAPIK